jgi:superfamily II DNA or RNA helicase
MNSAVVATTVGVIGYIYVRLHESYDKYNICKLGKTTNIPSRGDVYATGEPVRGVFELVFEVRHEEMSKIETLLQTEFELREFHFKNTGGKEFYDRKIMNLIEPYLIANGFNFTKLTKRQIDILNRSYRIRKLMKKINISELIKILKSKEPSSKGTEPTYNWSNKREYQTRIIKFSENALKTQNKIYIELPTGGGKSFIVYNLFEYLKSEFIIIVSPRKIVNSQNISHKYLQILTDTYTTFNYSIDEGFDTFLQSSVKKILICCTQSIDKIYEKILSNGITNITIWFDEAHWAIENWVDDIKNQFWLSDNRYIKNRIFTSASPNKPKVLEYEYIFGKLYSPIKVKELTELNWLTPIKPLVYSENKTNVNNLNYIISDFNEENRNFGFSYHNTQQNAFNLFYKHYKKYKNEETHIKPFLLVSDSFADNIEPRLKEIELDYKYREIRTYETSIHSIGYVVAKYNMGYDFNKLDFICLSDPKLSIQDIIQCIGRGIRPDGLGENGSNKGKILIVSLPVYIDENGENKYEKIIEVLKYLVYDIEMQFEEIVFKNRYIPSFKETERTTKEYVGFNDVKSNLLNLLEFENKRTALSTTYEKARKIIVENNVTSRKSYYALCDKDHRLHKEPEIVFKGQFTNWKEYLSMEGNYYDFETCKNKVGEYLLLHPEIKNHYFELSVVCEELCKLDSGFPSSDIWTDYYNVKDLKNIIVIPKKKKKGTGIL